MAIRQLANRLYVSPQLTQTDIQNAADLGIQSIICNRPDGEEDGQPAFQQIKQWCEAAGIQHVVHQPVVAPSINRQDVDRFQDLLAEAQQPVLAYCRTGTRCSLLWAYHQVAEGMPVAEAVSAAKQAGIDLTAFETRLNEAAAGSM